MVDSFGSCGGNKLPEIFLKPSYDSDSVMGLVRILTFYEISHLSCWVNGACAVSASASVIFGISFLHGNSLTDS